MCIRDRLSIPSVYWTSQQPFPTISTIPLARSTFFPEFRMIGSIRSNSSGSENLTAQVSNRLVLPRMENPALFSSIVSAPGVCFREVNIPYFLSIQWLKKWSRTAKFASPLAERMINALELRSCSDCVSCSMLSSQTRSALDVYKRQVCSCKIRFLLGY